MPSVDSISTEEPLKFRELKDTAALNKGPIVTKLSMKEGAVPPD